MAGLGINNNNTIIILCVYGRFGYDHELFVQRTSYYQLPIWERPSLSPFPWWACTTQVSKWRGALYCMQTVWGCLSCSGIHTCIFLTHLITCTGCVLAVLLSPVGHHYRGRDPCRWQQKNNSLWHWHDQMHLLWILPGSLSCGCNRRGTHIYDTVSDASSATQRDKCK